MKRALTTYQTKHEQWTKNFGQKWQPSRLARANKLEAVLLEIQEGDYTDPEVREAWDNYTTTGKFTYSSGLASIKPEVLGEIVS